MASDMALSVEVLPDYPRELAPGKGPHVMPGLAPIELSPADLANLTKHSIDQLTALVNEPAPARPIDDFLAKTLTRPHPYITSTIYGGCAGPESGAAAPRPLRRPRVTRRAGRTGTRPPPAA